MLKMSFVPIFSVIASHKKKETLKTQNLLWDWLSHEDSNLDRQYQKL